MPPRHWRPAGRAPPCRSPPPRWARARSTRRIRCRSASSAISWERAARTRYLRPMVERGRRRPARRQPHQPERHRQLVALPRPETAKYIHIDVDGQEVGRNYEALRLVGDARLTLDGPAPGAGRPRPRRTPRSAAAGIERRIADGLARRQKPTSSAGGHGPGRRSGPSASCSDLDSLLTPGDHRRLRCQLLVDLDGNFLVSRKAGMRFLTPRGLAGLGWGLPFALGAKAARPDATGLLPRRRRRLRPCLVRARNGAPHGAHVIVIVLNNQILGYQKHAEKVTFDGYTDVCDFTSVDHATIARACGCDGVRVEDPADFKPALESAMRASTTTVIDVITDEHAYPPITSFDGKCRTRLLAGGPERNAPAGKPGKRQRTHQGFSSPQEQSRSSERRCLHPMQRITCSCANGRRGAVIAERTSASARSQPDRRGLGCR